MRSLVRPPIRVTTVEVEIIARFFYSSNKEYKATTNIFIQAPSTQPPVNSIIPPNCTSSIDSGKGMLWFEISAYKSENKNDGK